MGRKKVYDMKWSEYNDLCDNLKSMVEKSEVKFKSILAISRGGLLVGVYLSHQLKLPLFVISAKFHDDFDNTTLHIDPKISGVGNPKPPILIVDEINDTGTTLTGVSKYLHNDGIVHFQKDLILDTCTAALVEKKYTKIRADFVAKRIKTKSWIHFPYEKYPAKGIYEIYGFSGVK